MWEGTWGADLVKTRNPRHSRHSMMHTHPISRIPKLSYTMQAQMRPALKKGSPAGAQASGLDAPTPARHIAFAPDEVG